MNSNERKRLNAAIRADMKARRFVIIEKMHKASTYEEYRNLMERLNAIDLHLECHATRLELHQEYTDMGIRVRWNASAKERSLTVTHR